MKQILAFALVLGMLSCQTAKNGSTGNTNALGDDCYDDLVVDIPESDASAPVIMAELRNLKTNELSRFANEDQNFKIEKGTEYHLSVKIVDANGGLKTVQAAGPLVSETCRITKADGSTEDITAMSSVFAEPIDLSIFQPKSITAWKFERTVQINGCMDDEILVSSSRSFSFDAENNHDGKSTITVGFSASDLNE